MNSTGPQLYLPDESWRYAQDGSAPAAPPQGAASRASPPGANPAAGGDWLCQCGNMNWAKRVHSCNRCGAARAAAATAPATRGGVAEDPPPQIAGGLTGMKRKALIAQATPSEGSNFPVYGDSAKRHAHGPPLPHGAPPLPPGAPPGIRPEVGDWNCTCGNWNWAKRATCNRCQGAKPEPGMQWPPGAPRGGGGRGAGGYREIDDEEASRRRQREAEARDAAAARKAEKRKCEWCHRASCIC